MKKRRTSLLLPIVIAVVAMPALLSLFYFKLTGDPTLRPLGVTQASLSKHDSDVNGRGIVVQIYWGNATRTRTSKANVRNALAKTLDAYVIDYRIRIDDVEGQNVEVFYLVDSSRIGPYRLHNLSAGIPAALAAYEMSSEG